MPCRILVPNPCLGFGSLQVSNSDRMVVWIPCNPSLPDTGPCLSCRFSMAGIEDLWSRFSLTEEEELGADVPRQGGNVVHRLAGKFFIKRVVKSGSMNIQTPLETYW